MKSNFFYGEYYLDVAEQIKTYINSAPDFLSRATSKSTRAAGDAIESLIAERFDTFLGEWCKEYSSNFARRAMADVAFKDQEGFYCVVDVKTHREDTKFNMPNLTSVERLTRFYEDNMNIFALIMVKYTVQENRVRATEVSFSPIEFLDWNCLTVGALGWGQIQISNSNFIQVNHGYSRKQWMLTLCETMFEFYPKEIQKIQERMGRFQELKESWEQKPDIWI
ncbi:hypothetical protein PCC7418_1588 [Halothece sp. PCC 7418]|uniref:hypothetical protein n=1 Tax=Halothece sp. (strain PCC 7418) TaxID=65093 RepID=UPI0002A05ACC|nr:hypothetical protein [Halothece sp. PCC 7418]AFZ43774.1 hypothetical protein PCC7418_1588 [Halothece sp. PCC 7418]